MNFVRYIKVTMFLFLVSLQACSKDLGTSIDIEMNVPDESITLQTKTIYISQNIDGNVVLRPVIIQTPNVINPDINYPIVFAFHGRGGSNINWVNQLKAFTDAGDFIGIYPQGFLQSWNLGQEPSTADDVAFVNLIIEEISNYPNLNLNKMYALGLSNGSGMVNKLGIETSHFKAIAPIVSQLMESIPILPNTQPISVYQVNGAVDDIIPINGGSIFGHVFLDAYESAESWANNFECDASPETISQGVNTLYIFKSCNDNKEIRYLRIENAGHNLFSTTAGLMNNIWMFFQRY